MRLLLANLHVTSDPDNIANWFERQVALHELEVACFQEMNRDHGRAIYRLTRWSTGIGLGQVAVAVNGGRPRSWVKLGNKTWFGWRANKEHPTRWMTFIKEPFLIGSTHAPPGVDATQKGLKGKADRVLAWVSFVRAFRRWAKKNPGPFVVAADWNDQPFKRGPFSIRWLAKKTNAKIVGHGIDYLLVRGVQAKHVTCVPAGPGMDHDAHVFEIED